MTELHAFSWLFVLFVKVKSQNNDIILYDITGFWKILNSWHKIMIIYLSTHPSPWKNPQLISVK